MHIDNQRAYRPYRRGNQPVGEYQTGSLGPAAAARRGRNGKGWIHRMNQSRQNPSMDDRIRQYSEELMRTYRRHQPSLNRQEAAAPPRDIPAPMPRAAEEAKCAERLPEDPIRGEIPPAAPTAPIVPPPQARPTQDEDDEFCRPHYPVESPAFSSSPSSPGRNAIENERSHPGPGITLFPDLPSVPQETGTGTDADRETVSEEEFLPPSVVFPPDEEATYAFPGEAEAREVAAPAEAFAAETAGSQVDDTPPSGNTDTDIPGESNPLSDYIPPAAPETGIAHLRIWVTTARQAVPIEGARVVVTKEGDDGGQSLVKVLTTNQDGNTATIDLPAVAAQYSQTPGFDHPYTTYTIEISKPGYFTIKNTHVPLYGGITSIQPADLIPLPEGAGLDAQQEDIVIDESSPQTL